MVRIPYTHTFFVFICSSLFIYAFCITLCRCHIFLFRYCYVASGRWPVPLAGPDLWPVPLTCAADLCRWPVPLACAAVRSLNLSNAVAVVLFEALRKIQKPVQD